MLQYDKLQLCNIIWVYPVFRRLPDEILLASSSCTVTFNRVSPCSYKVVEPRKLDNEFIVVVFEERFCFQSCSENWLEVPLCLFLNAVSIGSGHIWGGLNGPHIMLFNNLLEPRVVHLREFGQIVHIGNNITQILF